MSVKENGHEPSPDLPVILDLPAVLPSEKLKSMRVWCQESFITHTINRARNNEHEYFKE